MIQRTVLFANGKGYNIPMTMDWINNVYDHSTFRDERLLAEIMQLLHDCEYLSSPPEFLPHVDTGVLMETSIWFHHFGIEDDRFNVVYEETIDDGSVQTFPVDVDDVDFTLSDDEELDTEDEEELCREAAVLHELHRETIDLTYDSDDLKDIVDEDSDDEDENYGFEV